MALDHISRTMSDITQRIQADASPIQTEPPALCCDCKQKFPARRGEPPNNDRWAEICFACKRKRYHRLENFPPLYQGLSFKKVKLHAGIEKAFAAAHLFAQPGGNTNLWFYGSAGTGKTFLASAAAAEGPIGVARFTNVPEMLLKFQASVRDHDELRLIAEYAPGIVTANTPKIQLFDDVGAHRVSDFAIEMFGLVLDRLYSHNVTGLIFTSNLSPRDIFDTMGERISSRMRGLAEPVKLEGGDWRAA